MNLTNQAKRFKIVIAYDGTDFEGWQSQSHGKTVQDTIELSLYKILKSKTRLHGASRTDSGVHAWGQVGHFDAVWPYATSALKKALSSQLPETIFIRSLIKASEDFHARFSAKGKRYSYKIKLSPTDPFEARSVWGYRYPIDFQLLKAALKACEGRHDFSSFAGTVHKEETPVKTLTKISAAKKGDYIQITLEGSGFLYKMCRGIVGGAMEVARGKLTLARFRELLKKPQRTHEIVTAPAKGLRLEKVFY